MKSVFEQIKRYESQEFVEGRSFKIILPPQKVLTEQESQSVVEKIAGDTERTITVKMYMTQPSTPSFDFMKKWNNDIPMPLRTMVGVVERETPGMQYMKLHGEARSTTKCMKCGRTLTNKISRLYGIGPECGGHWGINPFSTEEELKGHLKEIEDKMSNITWEGWVIKSAITEEH